MALLDGGRARGPNPPGAQRDRSGHPLRRRRQRRAPTTATAPRRLLGALLEADRVFRLFRSSFLGKASPVHFFWGSFDLAVTRFSGRPAPLHPGGIPNLPDDVTREAYSHEVSSAGFWPGGAGGGGDPFFYSYAYPSPEGFARGRVEPEAARFDEALGEFVLPYEAVRAAADPDAALTRLPGKHLRRRRRSRRVGPRGAGMRARRAAGAEAVFKARLSSP